MSGTEGKKPVKGKRSPRWAFMQRMVIPCESGENYLTRLRILQTPWFGVYLHDINAADFDQDPHDHPWDFKSFIIKGGYTETRHYLPHIDLAYAYERHWGRFSWHKMPIGEAHRIVHVKPGTRSLIFAGRRRRTWGFFTKDGWMEWAEYESIKLRGRNP